MCFGINRLVQGLRLSLLTTSSVAAARVTQTHTHQAQGAWLPVSRILNDAAVSFDEMNGLTFTGSFALSLAALTGPGLTGSVRERRRSIAVPSTLPS